MQRPQLNRLKRSSFDWPGKMDLVFPKGLFGFESYVHYSLACLKKDEPFLRLEAKEDTTFFFHVIDPFLECPDYVPRITGTDLSDLKVPYEGKLFLLAIVNTQERPFTMNLAAPLLIHWTKKIGKQLLLPEPSEYPITI